MVTGTGRSPRKVPNFDSFMAMMRRQRFRLYLATALARPRFSPRVATALCVVDFSVTALATGILIRPMPGVCWLCRLRSFSESVQTETGTLTLNFLSNVPKTVLMHQITPIFLIYSIRMYVEIAFEGIHVGYLSSIHTYESLKNNESRGNIC